MAISLKTLQSTSTVKADGLKCCVYGRSGAGKTRLIPTLPAPLILSAESGLLSIAEFNLPFIHIDGVQTLREAHAWITGSEEAAQFQSIALDSISEIAETVLASEKKTRKDVRQAYGEMSDIVADIIRAFRDIKGKNVVFLAKLEKGQDEMGRGLYVPSMPGNKSEQALPYFFDEVFALQTQKGASGEIQRAILTQSDGLWEAKDRSGKLAAYEPADLGSILKKITA